MDKRQEGQYLTFKRLMKKFIAFSKVMCLNWKCNLCDSENLNNNDKSKFNQESMRGDKFID